MIVLACTYGQDSTILVRVCVAFLLAVPLSKRYRTSSQRGTGPLLKGVQYLFQHFRFVPLSKRFTEKMKDFVPLSQPVYGTGRPTVDHCTLECEKGKLYLTHPVKMQ
jgi:hypothetical protein